MRRKMFLLFSLITLLIMVTPMASSAQLWSGILDPSRAIDWSQAGVVGGIPNRTTICATLNPGATAAQINAAIAACPANQVVFLNAGTYTISGITFNGKSNVTLRGAGPDQTILRFSSRDSCGGLGGAICVSGNNSGPGSSIPFTVNWTAGFSTGTTQITLSSVANLAVGMFIFLDQLDDSGTDTGNIWVCESAACSTATASGGQRPGRAQLQIVKVTAINGTVVTITPGLYMPNWSLSQTPQAWWISASPSAIVQFDSVENLTVDQTPAGTNGVSGIYFFNAANSWVKNVRGIQANRNHVWFFQSAHITVRDSYFYGNQSTHSEAYGLELYISSDNLIENNIFEHIVAPVLVNGGDVGLVAGYNYNIDNIFSPSTWLIPTLDAHSAGVSMQLFEGNEGSGLQGDDVHGTHDFITAFRNILTGTDINGQINQTTPILVYAFNRYYNAIGNVLGTAGYHNQYTSSLGSGNPDLSIYGLGQSNISAAQNDNLVITTLMRWGNYDTVNNAVRFVSAEVPSGISPYGNAVPASQTLPASFYLSAKPSWWGTMPWPAIGPDVTGGNVTSGSGAASTLGGHAYKIPAKVCYDSLPLDGANPYKLFNANNCQAPAVAVAPPTNLRVQ